MLRTGVQSQLEGIRSAINHLHTAREDLLGIEKGFLSLSMMSYVHFQDEQHSGELKNYPNIEDEDEQTQRSEYGSQSICSCRG